LTWRAISARPSSRAFISPEFEQDVFAAAAEAAEAEDDGFARQSRSGRASCSSLNDSAKDGIPAVLAAAQHGAGVAVPR